MVIIILISIPYSILAIGTGYSLSNTYENIAVTLSVGTACVFVGAWLGAMISFILAIHIQRQSQSI